MSRNEIERQKKMKNITIIGQGFVGGALREGMIHAFDILTFDIKEGHFSYIRGIKHKNSLVSSDENYDYLIEQSEGPIFVCVPTPMNPDGSCNTNIVESVVSEIDKASKKLNKNTIVVIKSTVIPGTCEKLGEKYNNCYVCFNPEFLTERNAVEDFKNQDRIIIGGPREGTDVLKQVYERAYPNVPVTKTSSKIAEMVKYVTNCFLAVKVSFANEIYQLCEKLDIDYDKTVEYFTKDKRLGTSHWAVPGPMPADDGSGRLLPGYSGSCFVKDINALIAMSYDLGIDPKVMKGSWEKNLEVRPEKDWENLKGRAIN